MVLFPAARWLTVVRIRPKEKRAAGKRQACQHHAPPMG